MKTYVVYNKRCGHVLAVSRERETLRRQIAAVAPAVAAPWRIRVGADEDLAALVGQVRCETCDIGEHVPALALDEVAP